MKDLKIFTDNIEDSAKQQIDLLLAQEAFKDCKVRIMSDVHAGAGCVIGFTANLGDKVIPNIVGVDIGCGMTWAMSYIPAEKLNKGRLDRIIREHIPNGKNVREYGCEIDNYFSDYILHSLRCKNELRNPQRYIQRSLGTLGGGNHFIEVDVDQNGNCVFVVHSGSRNLGKQVCEIYQNKAIKHCSYEKEFKEKQTKLIKELKEEGETHKIQDAIKELKELYSGKTKLPKDLCYLEGQDREDYLHDMKLCQYWASKNREHMLSIILYKLCEKLDYPITKFSIRETTHNYISQNNTVRKGAIDASMGRLVLIPMNMRDGCIIARGKGNEDWNCSAPHGAGRIMSRNEARQKLSIEDYKKEMSNVYTTCIGTNTIDEAPMAYKPMQEIVNKIKDTVDVLEVIKPIYNFKAGE